MAACNVCRALTNRHELLNQRCEGCEATGVVGSQECAECKGFGWKMYG